MKHANISLFVPHAGCPNQCSFCNQKTISGKVKELTAEESKLRSELFNLTFQNKVGQLQNTSAIREVKKNIARVKTVLTQKKLAGAKE